MKISNIKVDIKENDLFDIINEVIKDFLKMDDLNILSVMVQDYIYIEGIFKHKINIKFSIKLSVDKLQDNILYMKIDSIKCMNIKIPKVILKGIFKLFLKKYSEIGVSMEENNLVLNLNSLMPIIPYINFRLERLELNHGMVSTEVSNMVYDMKKEVQEIEEILKHDKIPESDMVKEVLTYEEAVEKYEEQSKVRNARKIESEDMSGKVQDAYSAVREATKATIDEKISGASSYILFLPDLIALIARLFKDKRVKKKDKIIAGIMMTYVVIPIDLIPEEIPVLGKLDDIIILFIGLDYLLNSVDSNVIKENWEGKEDIITLIKQGVAYASEFSAGGKIKKFINVLSSM